MNRIIKIILITVTTVVVVNACSESNVYSEPAIVTVSLIDEPAAYDSVVIDLQSILIKSIDLGFEEGKWLELNNFTPKKYNLLDLTNGSEALLGKIELPRGELSQIWLILGDKNRISVNKKSYALKILPEDIAGAKVKLDDKIKDPSEYKLLIDFDAGRSVSFDKTNGEYYLKPVLRAALNDKAGAIEGTVTPLDSNIVIYISSETDTITAFPDINGYFLVRALDPGEYNILIKSSNESFKSVVINQVITKEGIITHIGTVTLEN